MATRRIIVIGAGIGGLVGALLLAARGYAVTLFESAAGPGGKMREAAVGGARIDAGPTVLTMRWAFEEIFDEVGASLSDRLDLRPLTTLARHAWNETDRLDLFADIAESADAIGDFAGKREAEGYLEFCRRSGAIYKTLERPFLRGSRPNPLSLTSRVGVSGLGDLWRISPFQTMWSALGGYFRDPRLRQLFGRYATYCGSSPYLAPATLMLVAHVEQSGVWRVAGGMHRLAQTLADLAAERGADIRYGRNVAKVLVERGRVGGVQLEDGERVEADAILFNGDASALGAGLLGPEAVRAAPQAHKAPDSLSALTWAIVGEPQGFALTHHNVFFSEDYRAEFDDILVSRRLPKNPTIYICAQDRSNDEAPPVGAERMFCLVNAPPIRADHVLSASEIERCEHATFQRLTRLGLDVRSETSARVRTGPAEFARMFPASGGALYGPASHGWRASFARPGSRTRLPGLYLAGGSVHPGPGAPMAALSGRLAAQSVTADLASMFRSVPAAMPGGTSTR